jgi:hypothetical protein
MGDPMSSIVVSGDTSGAITIAAPAVSGTNTLTLPASTGTVALTSQLPVAGPAFSAYLSSNLNVTDNVITKVTCDTEEFDTNTCYDNSTNYRFTPNVAGYYQVTVQCYYNTNANRPTSFYNLIYKNGSAVKTNYLFATSTTLLGQAPLTALIYCNGSTDYIEFYARASGGTSQFFSSGSTNTFFQAFLARTA